MARSEYCIVNQLDDHYDNIKSANETASEAWHELIKLIKPNNVDDRDKFDDLVTTIGDTLSEVETECDELNDLIDGADTFARENLQSERDAGFDEGREEGYNDGWEGGYEEGKSDAEGELDDARDEGREAGISDCKEHYEELVREIVDEFTDEMDPIDKIATVRKYDEKLEDEGYDD